MLNITHTDNGQNIAVRRICPLSVMFLDGTLILLACFTLRQGLRKFPLHRVTGVAAAEAFFRPVASYAA